MFTGIIEGIASIEYISHFEKGARIRVKLDCATELKLGESVSVNGCCLTVSERHTDENAVSFDLLQETLNKTNLGDLEIGERVNYERAMRMSDRMSGHYVQGHVDTTAIVLEYLAVEQDHKLTIEMPADYSQYTVSKGSICVDGMSLTIAEISEKQFSIWITPHTHKVTNLSGMRTGKRVNLEFDIIAKYVERLFDRLSIPSKK